MPKQGETKNEIKVININGTSITSGELAKLLIARKDFLIYLLHDLRNMVKRERDTFKKLKKNEMWHLCLSTMTCLSQQIALLRKCLILSKKDRS